MASSANDCLLQRTEEDGNRSYLALISSINELKEKIQADRILTIKEKLKKNEVKLESYVQQILSVSSMDILSVREEGSRGGSSCFSAENSIYMANPNFTAAVDKHTLFQALNFAGRLPAEKKLHPYTTWAFLRRNQRMAEDQSVVGMKRIYYDKSGSEALICSDSEEELSEPSENAKKSKRAKSIESRKMEMDAKSKDKEVTKRHEYSDGENQILWMAFQAYGCEEKVAKMLTQHIGGTITEIQEQYSKLKENSQNRQVECATELSLVLEKSLSEASDSLDSLYCRLCLAFDCKLHDSSLSVYASEKLPFRTAPDSTKKPCSDHCYLLAKQTSEPLAETSDSVSRGIGKMLSLPSSNSERDGNKRPAIGLAALTLTEVREGVIYDCEWKPFEKDLFAKGVEIYGRNCCLIARNCLSPRRSCIEVFSYMQLNSCGRRHKSGGQPSTSLSQGKGEDPMDIVQETENSSKSRSSRRRGRMWRHKFSSKSAARFPWLKRVGNGKPKPQYTPCECQSMCSKDCTCIQNQTCCEKYCGCSVSCPNRYRGCHCSKGDCRTKQCPCFYAERECDPDVCRNCWVSCGDGSLGEPPKQGEGQCGNMKMLQRQQKQVLWGPSDITGWGAFAKHPVNKNDYLGEYTGELIDHYEADKRGKIYDRADSSYLFDLNEEWVIDAYRKGNKLKFANHSLKPNCYCKTIQVGPDHRVGIFAKENIEAQQELLYNYSYGETACPPWARKPGTRKSNKNDASTSKGRAKKYPTSSTRQ